MEDYLKSFKDVCTFCTWSDEDILYTIQKFTLVTAIGMALDGAQPASGSQTPIRSTSQEARPSQPQTPTSVTSPGAGSRSNSPKRPKRPQYRPPIVSEVVSLDDSDEETSPTKPRKPAPTPQEELEVYAEPEVTDEEEDDFLWLRCVMPRVSSKVMPSQRPEDPDSLRSEDSGLKFGSDDDHNPADNAERPSTPRMDEFRSPDGSNLSKADSDLIITSIVTRSPAPALQTAKTELTFPMDSWPTCPAKQTASSTVQISSIGSAIAPNPSQLTRNATAVLPAPEVEEKKVKPKKNDPAYQDKQDSLRAGSSAGGSAGTNAQHASNRNVEEEEDDPLAPDAIFLRVRPPPAPAEAIAPPAKRSVAIAIPLPGQAVQPPNPAGVDAQLFPGPISGMVSRLPTDAEHDFLHSLEVPAQRFHLPPFPGHRMANFKSPVVPGRSAKQTHVLNWVSMLQQQHLAGSRKKKEYEQFKREMLMVVDADFAYTEYGSGVMQALQALKIPVTTAKLPCRNTIIWRRVGFEYQLKTGLLKKPERNEPSFPLTSYTVEVDHFILILTPEQWAVCTRSFDSIFIREAKELNPGKAMSIMILHPTTTWTYTNLTHAQVADLTIAMQLKHDIRNIVVETAAKYQWIAVHLMQWTRALAYRQYEFLNRDNDSIFSTREVTRNDIAVDKGESFKAFMLCAGLTAAVANSIISLYPSGAALARAYEAQATEADKENMLSGVQTTYGPIGLDASRHVYYSFAAPSDLVPGNEPYTPLRKRSQNAPKR